MSIALEKNKDQNKLLVADLNKKTAQMKLGGGKSRLEKIRLQGKMTARERINFLLDEKNSYMTGHSLVIDGGRTIW